MAITSTTRDVRYPSPGNKVTLNCVYTVGNRFRCKLTNKPIDSALECYEAAKDNYIDGNQITPDVVGCYTVTFVEETVSNPVPHFSNDTGAGQCVEVVTPIATATHYITVVGKVKRQIGFAPDDCTIELHATTDDFAPGFVSPAAGALTRYTDATRCPVLVDPTSDAAKIAVAADIVARLVAEIGGYGNASTMAGVRSYKYGDRADQVLPIVSYADIEDTAVLTSFQWTIQHMNNHIAATLIRVHGVADAANVLLSPVAVVGDEPSQRTLLNEILTNLFAHASIGGGGVHVNADTVCTGELAALAPLPNPSTLSQRVARTNVLFNSMDAHMNRTWISTAWTVNVHQLGADNHLDYDAYYPACDEASVVALANHMRTRFGCTVAPTALEHLGRVLLCAANYHAIGGGAASTYNDTMPVDAPGLISGVRKALQVLHAHVTNVEFTTGTSVVYHTAADWGSRTDVIPGPSDYVGALNALEALSWMLARHAQLGTSTHDISHQGNWKKRPQGIEAIHHAFRTAVTYTGMSVGASENAAFARLIVGGGFSKG